MPENQEKKAGIETLENVLQSPGEEKGGVLKVQDDAGIEESAAGSAETVEENASLAGLKPENPSPGKPSWHAEPIGNFEIDPAGKVRLNKKGEPIRKSGRPKKAKPGDVLADGTTAPADAAEVSKVVTDGDDPGEPAAEVDDTLGPAAGDVLVEAADNTARAVKGDKAGMTKAERESIKKAARSVTSGVRLWPPLALLIFLGAWALRVALTNRQARTQRADDGGDNTRDDHRADEDRENVTGKAAFFGNFQAF